MYLYISVCNYMFSRHASLRAANFWHPTATYTYVYICIYIYVFIYMFWRHTSLRAASTKCWLTPCHTRISSILLPPTYMYSYLCVYIYTLKACITGGSKRRILADFLSHSNFWHPTATYVCIYIFLCVIICFRSMHHGGQRAPNGG